MCDGVHDVCDVCDVRRVTGDVTPDTVTIWQYSWRDRGSATWQLWIIANSTFVVLLAQILDPYCLIKVSQDFLVEECERPAVMGGDAV